MKPEDDDWTALSDMWGDEPAERTDPSVTDLLRVVRRRDFWGRMNFYSEILGGCGVAAAVGYVAFTRDGGWPLAIAGLAFTAFAVALTVWSRIELRPAVLETPADALRSAIQQARSGLRWAQAGIVMCWAAVAFLGVTTFMIGDLDGSSAALYAAAAVFLLGIGLFYRRHGRRCRRRIDAAHAALAELDLNDPG